MGFTVLLVAFLSAVTMAFWLRLPQGNWTRLRQLCAELSEQGVEVSLQTLETLSVFAALVFCWLAWLGGLVAVGCGTLISLLCWGALRRLQWQRDERLEQQVGPWLDQLARSLKAAPAIADAIEATVPATPRPLSKELEICLEQLQLGQSLDQALERASGRVRSRRFQQAIFFIRVARKTGGHVPSILSGAAESFRELDRLDGVLRAKTAEGKMQAWVIAFVPVPLYVGVTWSDPHYFDALFRSSAGELALLLAVLCWLGAVLLAHRILAIEF